MALGELISVRVYTPCPTKAEANPPNLHNAQGPVYMGYTHRGPLSHLIPAFQTGQRYSFLFPSHMRMKGHGNGH